MFFRVISYLVLCLILSFNVLAEQYVKVITNSPIEQTTPSNKCKSEICIELLNLINNSKHTIDFAVYGLRGQNEVL